MKTLYRKTCKIADVNQGENTLPSHVPNKKKTALPKAKTKLDNPTLFWTTPPPQYITNGPLLRAYPHVIPNNGVIIFRYCIFNYGQDIVYNEWTC
jgi:hypothetical protein